MNTTLKSFSEIGTTYQVNDKYTIEIAEGDHLLISVPVEYGSSACKFDHPNIVSKKNEVLSFKHYCKNGHKFWTEKPGMKFLFIVPKSKIYLNEEKSGLSYVWVEIGGQEYCLSVSGGTSGDGWTDYVSQGSGTFVYKRASHLKAIAESATLSVDVQIAHRIPDKAEQDHFRRLCAYHDTKNKIQEGSKIFLGSSYSVNDCKGPFDVVRKPKRKRHFICVDQYGWKFKAYYKHIDWVKTAEINNVDLVNV